MGCSQSKQKIAPQPPHAAMKNTAVEAPVTVAASAAQPEPEQIRADPEPRVDPPAVEVEQVVVEVTPEADDAKPRFQRNAQKTGVFAVHEPIGSTATAVPMEPIAEVNDPFAEHDVFEAPPRRNTVVTFLDHSAFEVKHRPITRRKFGNGGRFRPRREKTRDRCRRRCCRPATPVLMRDVEVVRHAPVLELVVVEPRIEEVAPRIVTPSTPVRMMPEQENVESNKSTKRRASKDTGTPAKRTALAQRSEQQHSRSPPPNQRILELAMPKRVTVREPTQTHAERVLQKAKKKQRGRRNHYTNVQHDVYLQQCAAFERLLTHASTLDVQLSR